MAGFNPKPLKTTKTYEKIFLMYETIFNELYTATASGMLIRKKNATSNTFLIFIPPNFLLCDL